MTNRFIFVCNPFTKFHISQNIHYKGVKGKNIDNKGLRGHVVGADTWAAGVIRKLDDLLFKFYQVQQGGNAKYFQAVSCTFGGGCRVCANPTPLTKISTGWVTGAEGKA